MAVLLEDQLADWLGLLEKLSVETWAVELAEMKVVSSDLWDVPSAAS